MTCRYVIDICTVSVSWLRNQSHLSFTIYPSHLPATSYMQRGSHLTAAVHPGTPAQCSSAQTLPPRWPSEHPRSPVQRHHHQSALESRQTLGHSELALGLWVCVFVSAHSCVCVYEFVCMRKENDCVSVCTHNMKHCTADLQCYIRLLAQAKISMQNCKRSRDLNPTIESKVSRDILVSIGGFN